jgi:2-polyprenyl-3-methyl-5-hydroxy-6-metoxy-1,4-benzoquinol methylase
MCTSMMLRLVVLATALNLATAIQPSVTAYVTRVGSTIVKKVRPGEMAETYKLVEREVCVLNRLQQFPWAPRLLDSSKNTITMTDVGHPITHETLPSDYATQFQHILTDMESAGVRHNDIIHPCWANITETLRDLQKHEVMVHDGRLSLVDFGWATIDGGVPCNVSKHVFFQSSSYTQESCEDSTMMKLLDRMASMSSVPGDSFKPYRNKTRISKLRRAHVQRKDTYKDPSRPVGTQSEVPIVNIASDGAVRVRGYQNYDIYTDGQITFRTKAHKFSKIEAIFAKLHTHHGFTSLIDVGCNAGLISMIAWRTGFRHVMGLDHDSEYVETFNRVAAARNATDSLHAQVFSFGTPMPTRAEVVFCGAILHWVFCLTADFSSGGFDSILRYLLQFASEYLLVEWIDPSDDAMMGFQHIKKCGIDGIENRYTVANFERAVATHTTLMSKQSLDGPSRVLYVMRVDRRAGLSPTAGSPSSRPPALNRRHGPFLPTK